MKIVRTDNQLITRLLFFCLALFTFQIAFADGEIPIFRKNTSFEQACSKAKFQNKPVMLIISSKDCASYRNFTNRVLNDTAVTGLYDRNFICYNVDVETKEGKKLASQYNVLIFPVIIYLSPDRQVIFRSHGTDKPTVAAAEAKSVLDVMQTHNELKERALKMVNVSYLNRKLQKQTAIAYARNDKKEGRRDIEKQVFEYALNSDELKYFIKHYIKNMHKRR
jgi:uncharacterized protein YyaL (SSP411 family)